MFETDSVETLDARLSTLRSGISDLGSQVDSYKTKTAASLGGGVFLLFLAALTAYDVISGKGGVWFAALGIDGGTLGWLTVGLGIVSTVLLIFGFSRVKKSDDSLKTQLEAMEREYAELLEQREETRS